MHIVERYLNFEKGTLRGNGKANLPAQKPCKYIEVLENYLFLLAMLSQFFNTLFDEEVITEEAFMTWKLDESPSRQEAKGPALQATKSFFEWLLSATVEGGEN